MCPRRVYFEKYENDASKLRMATAVALEEIISIGLKLSDIVGITGFKAPTVIT
jgi:hypothetical protein